MVFLSGLFFLLLTLLGLRKKLVVAIPAGLISAISVGIGLFITFIGLVKLGVVVDNEVTLVSAGPLTPTVLIGLCGLILMIFLEAKKIRGALLVGIIFSTVLAGVFGYIERPSEWISLHLDIRAVAFRLDILGAFKWSLFGSIFSLMFMMKEVKSIDFSNLEEAFPAFIIMVMIALSYSISTGLAFGFISFVLIKAVSGKRGEVHVAMWIIAILSVLFLAINRLGGLFEYLRGLI